MFNRFFSLLFFSFFSLLVQAQISWPAISQTNKPWARWWWEGSAVNKKDLSWNLEQYQKAGLGGLEVTPIYGVHGYENQFIQFLSPTWMQMFDHTLREAKRLQLGIDLANATGWPFGGPWVTDADASKTVYWKSYSVNGGESLNENMSFFQQGLVRPANNKQVSIDTLRRPIAANKDLQSLAIDQIIYPDTLHVRLLMGYSDKGDTIDLTSKVDAHGKLNWTAPPGKWNLFALFVGMHGKMVERAAPGGEGYAIDHFSTNAVQHYFKKFDKAFQGHDISYLRAFFNDSYEVDDARGQANWTPDFLTEFQKRRGYNLAKELPALFQKEDAEKNARVIYDYRSTIDELLLEHFTQAWKRWGQSKSALVRNQSHGSPANTLDLYAAVDIPETEGNDVLRFKFASSASNVTGKQLTSSESATWLNEHFLSSLGDVKKAIDLYFLGGVNHIFYHGVAYSPQDAPWPGWLFYAAVHFQPNNPQWKDFHALNEYIARVQSFLQAGRPDNDILLYYPIVDRYSQPGNDLLQHFDGMERNFDGTDFQTASKWMGENGYSFDFFSDRQLQQFVVNGKQVITGGNPYQVILLPANKYIPLESLVKLLRLATTGATILCYKSPPQDVPGFGQLDKRRESFNSLLSSLQFQENGSIKKALIGKGVVLVGQDIGELLHAAGVRKESINSSGLQFVRRRNQNGNLYFIDNRSNKEVNEWVPLQIRAASVALYSAMSMQKGLAKWRKEKDGTVSVLLQLQPWESVIVQTYSLERKGSAYPYLQTMGNPIAIDGKWQIEFLSGGPTLPAKIETTELKSWTAMGGEDLRNFSGTAKYSISFSKPTGEAEVWTLDLGEMYSTAEVKLNGQPLGTLIGPSLKLNIAATQLKTTNTLEVIVSNLMANRIAYMDRNSLPWKIFYNTNMPARRRENIKNGLFDASSWQPMLSGLIGPVTLTPGKIQ
jgi:hypothetical protein